MPPDEIPTWAPPARPLLVVDDDQSLLELYREILEIEGYTVLEAISGAQAIILARVHRPALLLLDVMMPGMSGFDVCTHLRSTPETRSIPIIFVSAKTDSEAIVFGLNNGGDAYLTKPFKIEELLAHVHVLLRRAYPPADTPPAVEP